jgi:hypothetical protein
MFEILPPARHAGDSSNDKDNGQNRKYDDVEHDSVHHILEARDTEEETGTRGATNPGDDGAVRWLSSGEPE